MPKLHNFGARFAAMILGTLVLALLCPAQKKESSDPVLRSAQEEDIREAAYLYLFSVVGSGPDPDHPFYCLSVDSDGFKSLHDPPDALIKQLRPTHHTLRRASECEVLKEPKDKFSGGIRDKRTGKAAWMVSLTPVRWVNDHEATIGGQLYCGGLCGWSSTLRATLADGKWKVDLAPGAYVFFS